MNIILLKCGRYITLRGNRFYEVPANLDIRQKKMTKQVFQKTKQCGEKKASQVRVVIALYLTFLYRFKKDTNVQML